MLKHRPTPNHNPFKRNESWLPSILAAAGPGVPAEPRRARGASIRVQTGPRNVPPRAVTARAFGTALRDLRTARGLTQEALADAAGLDRTYPSLLERGLRTPTILVVDRLVRGLGISASEGVEQFRKALDGLSLP